jgi:hypothetical protein
MLRWWPVIKQCARVLVGLSLLTYLTWLAFSQLFRVVSTGHLLVRGRDLSNRGYSTLISYDDAPLGFVANFGLAILMAGFGALIWVKLCLIVRKWWDAK